MVWCCRRPTSRRRSDLPCPCPSRSFRAGVKSTPDTRGSHRLGRRRCVDKWCRTQTYPCRGNGSLLPLVLLPPLGGECVLTGRGLWLSTTRSSSEPDITVWSVPHISRRKV